MSEILHTTLHTITTSGLEGRRIGLEKHTTMSVLLTFEIHLKFTTQQFYIHCESSLAEQQ